MFFPASQYNIDIMTWGCICFIITFVCHSLIRATVEEAATAKKSCMSLSFSRSAHLMDCDEIKNIFSVAICIFNTLIYHKLAWESHYLYYTTTPSIISRIIFSTMAACIQQLIAFCSVAINAGVQGIYEN